MRKTKTRIVTLTGVEDKLIHDLIDEIKDNGGCVTYRQLLHDAVNIMLQAHSNEIIQRYSPVLIKKRSTEVE